MSQPSPDAKAVVRAAEALTTQVRRIADALSTPVVRYEVAADDDDAVAPTCWHTEPGSPCDWDRCLQPERLAAGDQGVDPATTPPLGPKLRQRAQAVDEDAQHAGAPNLVRVLVDRAARGVLSPAEANALRRRVEQLIAGREMWKAKGEEMERDRDNFAEELTREQAASAGLAGKIKEQRSALDVMRAELTTAQAAIERVRAMAITQRERGVSGSTDHKIGLYDASVAILAALDGTEQPTTEA